jgi:hypothetical protein
MNRRDAIKTATAAMVLTPPGRNYKNKAKALTETLLASENA